LQEGVPDTIAELKKANIRIWVLTGDKLDTAENIGHACDLLNSKTHKYRFKDSNCDTVEKLEVLLHDAYEESTKRTNQGLLIEGKVALKLVLENDLLKKLFLNVAVNCEAVLCCRVSPIQKAKVVELVNERVQKGCVTLAIGDGGNDVSMIQGKGHLPN
jgi:magnesium-transporting ATPase (P-type)